MLFDSRSLCLQPFSRRVLVSAGAFLLLVSGQLCMPVLADCQSSYADALNQLNQAEKQAVSNQHPNASTFSVTFQKTVNTMKDQQCTGELVKLIEHIQSEQLKYPSSDPVQD